MARQPDAAPLRHEPAAERTHKLQRSPVVLRLSSSTPVLALRGAAWLTALAQAQWEQVSVVLLPCIPGAEAIERARGRPSPAEPMLPCIWRTSCPARSTTGSS